MNEMKEPTTGNNRDWKQGRSRRKRGHFAAQVTGVYLATIAIIFAFSAYEIFITGDGHFDPLTAALQYGATLPSSLLLYPVNPWLIDHLPDALDTVWGLFVAPGLCALVNAWLLWLIIRGRRVS
jgi:hypothetical protein